MSAAADGQFLLPAGPLALTLAGRLQGRPPFDDVQLL